MSRIDPDSGHAVAIPVGGEPSALAFGAGSLWVADGSGSTVAQVGPGANQVLQPLDAGNAPSAVAVGSGALWVASAVDGAVRRIGLSGPGTRHTTALGVSPTALAAGAGAIWVASEEAGTVTRLEPRTGAAVHTIHVGNGPSAVAVGAGAVWAVNRLDGTVSRIDPATNAVEWVLPVGGEPTAVAAGDGGVWVAGGDPAAVIQIDPDAPRELQRVPIGSSASAVALVGDGVWASAAAPQASHRGGVLRVTLPVTGPVRVPIDWLQHAAYSLETAEVVSLAYDGLVAYRRVAGVAGGTLVGALATEAPRPTDDGRTYTFTLRPGVRYSDGAPVRPADFRASLERFLSVTGGDPRFPPLYAGIVGARRCAARCDLSAGIETDEHARTITVHLTRPDADFLHKLTYQFAYVVPASTPARRLGDRPPPGTGPYRVAAWNSRSGGVLVRNPSFRSWSPVSRPAGFAERIAVDVRSQRDVGAQLAEVQRGESDVALAANAFKPLIPTERLSALTARSGGRLHRYPEAVLNYLFLNVRRPPFDHVRARRALNFAIDRGRIVAFEGGRQVATATCQVLPVGFPGHEPYCPYTAGAGPGRPWSAPDLDEARALVAASGTAGERVEVVVPGFQARRRPVRQPRAAPARLPRHDTRVAGGALLRRRLRPGLARAGRVQRLVRGLREPVQLHRGQLRLRGQPRPLLQPRADAGDGPRARRTRRRRDRTVGRDRPSRHRSRPRGAADEPALDPARLRAGRQRPAPRPRHHPARPALGALSAHGAMRPGRSGSLHPHDDP